VSLRPSLLSGETFDGISCGEDMFRQT